MLRVIAMLSLVGGAFLTIASPFSATAAGRTVARHRAGRHHRRSEHTST